jgi:hypothetical protein
MHGMADLRYNIKEYPPMLIETRKGGTRVLAAWAHEGTRIAAAATLQREGVPDELLHCAHKSIATTSFYVAVRPAGLKTLFLWQSSFPGVRLLLIDGETSENYGARLLLRETGRIVKRFDRGFYE